MTSFRQIEANRRNALSSTGPKTEDGKQRSRQNAVRHGLTSETVIATLEDVEDYQAFEAAVIADYDARTAVERELVLRLASLLWRIRALLPLRPISCRSRPRYWKTADTHSRTPTKRNRNSTALFIVFSGLQRIETRTNLSDPEGMRKESKLTINRIRSRRPPTIQSPIRVT